MGVCVCPGGQCTQLGNIFSSGDMQKPHSMLNMYINEDVYYYHYNCNFINYSNIAITHIKMGLIRSHRGFSDISLIMACTCACNRKSSTTHSVADNKANGTTS